MDGRAMHQQWAFAPVHHAVCLVSCRFGPQVLLCLGTSLSLCQCLFHFLAKNCIHCILLGLLFGLYTTRFCEKTIIWCETGHVIMLTQTLEVRHTAFAVVPRSRQRRMQIALNATFLLIHKQHFRLHTLSIRIRFNYANWWTIQKLTYYLDFVIPLDRIPHIWLYRIWLTMRYA